MAAGKSRWHCSSGSGPVFAGSGSIRASHCWPSLAPSLRILPHCPIPPGMVIIAQVVWRIGLYTPMARELDSRWAVVANVCHTV